MATIELSDEEVAALRRLIEIEKIRQVANLYSQLMDGREWDRMAGLYTEDALCEWGPYGTWHGRAAVHRALVDGHPGRLPFDGLHITTNLQVELTGPDTAVSRNYLTDFWQRREGEADGPISHPGWPANPVILYAIYDNDYRKEADEWRIARSQIQFLWPKRDVREGFPRRL